MSQGDPHSLHRDTVLIHAGEEFNQTSAVTPPIWQTSTYHAPENPRDFAELAASLNPGEFYSRHGNPTTLQVQSILASLEKTEAALVTSSGMAAISSLLFSQLKSGDHVVTQSSLYAATMLLFRDVFPRYSISVSFVDSRDHAAFEAALRKDTRLIYVETPVNPLMTLTDLTFIGELGRRHGILTVCDNTFASPINQRPAELGIDGVVHSATKYLGGHSDLTAGAICGPKSLVDAAWRMMIIQGSSLASMDAWLLLRGLRTLSLRMERINSNALAIATFLKHHPKVPRVNFPFLPDHPQHPLATSQMSGPSGMMSFEVAPSQDAGAFEKAQRFIQSVHLAKNAVSLGGVETLLVHPASMWGYHYTPEQRQASGIGPGLVRLSVGIEDSADLIGDIDAALSKI